MKYEVVVSSVAVGLEVLMFNKFILYWCYLGLGKLATAYYHYSFHKAISVVYMKQETIWLVRNWEQKINPNGTLL